MSSKGRQPAYFISHGGGPWPFLDKVFRDNHAPLERALQNLFVDESRLPRAILMVSGHWEERTFTVSGSPQPPMLYDYYGFPPHTYEIQYPAPGWPELAERVHSVLKENGFATRIDPHRGYDHGTFVVMGVARPQADIPVVQLSLKVDYDPAEHIAVGKLLAPLRAEGIAIVGSGSSFHNMRLPNPGPASRAFDAWLQETLVDRAGEERLARLTRWTDAPAARLAHAAEEHLLPLMVVAGAAGEDAGHMIHYQEDFFGDKTLSSFRFD